MTELLTGIGQVTELHLVNGLIVVLACVGQLDLARTGKGLFSCCNACIGSWPLDHDVVVRHRRFYGHVVSNAFAHCRICLCDLEHQPSESKERIWCRHVRNVSIDGIDVGHDHWIALVIRTRIWCGCGG